MVLTKLDNPVESDVKIPSPPAGDCGAGTDCGRYCDGRPMMGREMGRSPG